jgi:DNA-binding NtrC family response regulator
MRVLVAHDWPGNVRELENCIERCCATNSGLVIHTSDLSSSIPWPLVRQTPTGTDQPVVPLSVIEKQTILNTIAHHNGDKMTAAKLLGIGNTALYRKLKQYSASSGLSI